VRGNNTLRAARLLTSHLLPLTFLGACDPTLPPLRGQMEIGSDAYAVFVGGIGVNSDLYAIRADGGQPVRITFTNVAELRPALSPDGGALAFLRGTSLRDSTPASVWVMNLLSGSERELSLPKGAGRPVQVGWERAGTSLILEAERGLYRVNAPPLPPTPAAVPAHEENQAESTLAVLLGEPVFASVIPCPGITADLCVSGDGGSGLLARGAHDPARWGDDSVAFFVGDDLEVRPLAKGRPRRRAWNHAPERPRQLTFFPGKRDR
jgi:hypothetical protein